MPPTSDLPGRVEATALAIAGPAFAASLLFLRRATNVGPGVFDGAAAVLVALGAAPWVHRAWGPFFATCVRGAGLALGAVLAASALVAPFDGAALPGALAISGGTLLQANARRDARPLALVDAAALAVLGVALALGVAGAGAFPEPDRLRVTLFLVGATIVAGIVLRRVLVARRLAWLAPMPLGILLVAALGGVYLSYRGLVRSHVANLPLYEWTFAAAVATLLLARLRRKAREREVPDAWSGSALRHAQDVRPVYDERMGALAAAVGRYLDDGVGYEDYARAMARGGGAAPPPIAQPARGRRAARSEARQARIAAHATALAARTNGVTHGDPEPRVR